MVRVSSHTEAFEATLEILSAAKNVEMVEQDVRSVSVFLSVHRSLSGNENFHRVVSQKERSQNYKFNGLMK